MRIEIGQIITQIISFLVMLWVLKRYAWKPLLNILDERKQKIKDEFAAIEQQKKESEELNNKYKTQMREIDLVAKNKMDEIVSEAERVGKEIEKKADIQAHAIIAKAQADLQNEVLKAKMQLKTELVNITLAATQKMLQTHLSDEKQKEMIMEFVEQLESK